MPFIFTPDQRELADGVDRLLAAGATGTYARDVERGAASWTSLWREVAELGVPGIAAPEDAGGLGLGPVELTAVCEAVGRHLAPGPIVATAGGFVPAVAGADGAAADLLRRVVESGLPVALGFGDPLTGAGSIALDGDRLSVDDLLVADAQRSELLCFLVPRDAGGPALAIVPTETAAIDDVQQMDRVRPLGRVSLEREDAEIVAFPRWASPFDVAFITAAAEMVGMADRMLEISVEYAGERTQFGARIGSFQAVKHRLVDAHLQLERARSLVYRAAVRAAEGHEETTAAAHFAKAAACDAATEVARSAVQVHGGIGITAEHDISLFYLRARQASQMLGGRDFHYEAALSG